jgi:hypothetical protein
MVVAFSFYILGGSSVVVLVEAVAEFAPPFRCSSGMSFVVICESISSKEEVMTLDMASWFE